MSVKVKAYAKINLMLDIISTRKDGYHDLFMIMQSINLYDTVTISETKSKQITITCNIDDIPLYEKYADLSIDCQQKSIRQTVAEIARKLGNKE